MAIMSDDDVVRDGTSAEWSTPRRVPTEAARTANLSPNAYRMGELLEWAWGVIANVSGSDWTKQPAHWQKSAENWRDEAMGVISAHTKRRLDALPTTWWGDHEYRVVGQNVEYRPAPSRYGDLTWEHYSSLWDLTWEHYSSLEAVRQNAEHARRILGLVPKPNDERDVPAETEWPLPGPGEEELRVRDFGGSWVLERYAYVSRTWEILAFRPTEADAENARLDFMNTRRR